MRYSSESAVIIAPTRPGRREIVNLVQVAVANSIAGVVHARDFAVVCVVAFPSILKVGDMLIARFSAQVIGHHLLGVVDGARPGGQVPGSRFAQREAVVAETVDHPCRRKMVTHAPVQVGEAVGAVAHHHRDPDPSTVA
jgi:hypothetical protein